MVYLIHFRTRYYRARHYLGYTKSLKKRTEEHRAGQGSPLLRAVTLAGIEWAVVRTWPDGTRTLERRLKNRKKARHLCPKCQEEEHA